jgi:cytochrome c oxidase cbb3-type subunit 1
MNPAIVLASAFIISIVALAAFIWSMRQDLFEGDLTGANVIFAPDEVGRIEEPAGSSVSRTALQASVGHASYQPTDIEALASRAEADRSSATVTFVFFSSAVLWLIVGSLAGLTASIKLHSPDWLAQYDWLTFGRIRTVHLNAVAYGWAATAGLGLSIWLLPRLLKTPLVGGRIAVFGVMVWNAGLVSGLGAIAVGFNDGLEYLEMPWPAAMLLAAGGAFIGLPLIFTLQRRQVDHLYVSVWYMGAALFWLPVLVFVANLPSVYSGVQQATMNWWYGHNILGYFFTPLALASIYYFLPKVIGRPIQSYNLSLLGFWTLAFFYGQVGGHHLIGGPVPGWMITLSIVQSVMMVIPVAVFAVNQFMTLADRWGAVVYSPTLRFTALAGIMYILASVQGSMMALRSINTVTHFTHFTVAHAHLGLYGFVTLAFFGGIYFVMPRVVEREWPYPSLIAAHFWLVVAGFAVYFVGLTAGGLLQGLMMLDASKPFMDSVAVTIPYLTARSIGGGLMTLGHIVFAAHFVAMGLNLGPARDSPALLRPARGV